MRMQRSVIRRIVPQQAEVCMYARVVAINPRRSVDVGTREATALRAREPPITTAVKARSVIRADIRRRRRGPHVVAHSGYLSRKGNRSPGALRNVGAGE